MKKINVLYDTSELELKLPDNTTVYASSYPKPTASAHEIVHKALNEPIGEPPLKQALQKRRADKVVIVVSDVTRPIPYSKFLSTITSEIEGAGIPSKEILILIATGMHRPSTQDERLMMFGRDICSKYQILDHRADDNSGLEQLNKKSATGNVIKLNRHFVGAGFRIITGLVEPHFMVGFSGGRKTICPGLASLDTIINFHGYEFLANPMARNGQLEGNPCHIESLSVSRAVGVDFAFNMVLNQKRQITRVFAGDNESSHNAACEFVKNYACPEVAYEHDIVISSCGGFPLDATFYQCVKGMVACLPVIKPNGVILTFGGCREGIGSKEYQQIMYEYSPHWQDFLEDIREKANFRKDQWEFQMQARVLQKVGLKNLFFASDNFEKEKSDSLCVNYIPSTIGIKQAIQDFIDRFCQPNTTVAVLPEGPYCTPLKKK